MSENVNTAKILTADEEKSIALLKDGLENLVAQLGTSQDKRNAGIFKNNKQLSAKGNEQELNDVYRTDWLVGKVVDIIPDDMTREWRSFEGDIDPDTVDQLVAEEERLELAAKFNLAHKWARLYGTSLIVMSIDDGQTPDKPLDVENLKEDSLRYINVVDRHRISPNDVVPITDPLNKNYGYPEYYRFNETSVKIHHSRVIRFDGVLLPFDEFRRNNYFSDSVVDRLYESIMNFNIVTAGSASMVYETNVDIMKVRGLMQYLQTPEGESLLRKRFTMAGLLKSFNNMMLLDSEEDFQTKTNTFAGLPDLIDRYAKILASASDIPATRLLGDSPSGLNATGEGDMKNYYDKLKSEQMTEYKPKLDYFDEIMRRSLGLGDDTDMSYEFNSLFQMTPAQVAEIEFKNAQRDQVYLVNGVITEEIVAKELKQEGVYTNITDEYIKELEDLSDDIESDTDDIELKLEQENEGGEEETIESGEGS